MMNKRLYTARYIFCLYFAFTVMTSFLALPSITLGQVSLGQIVQQSVNTSGGEPNGINQNAALSPDARLLGFQSFSTNLVSSDLNNAGDVFVKDFKKNNILIESKTFQDAQGNDSSFLPSLSYVGPNNRYVIAFQSSATNLTPNSGFNGQPNIFVRFKDGKEAKTELISRIASGEGAPVGGCFNPTIGIAPQDQLLRVAFHSNSNDILPGQNNTASDIFIAEVKKSTGQSFSPTIKRITISSSGAEGDGDSINAQMSADAQFVVFETNAINLLPQLANSGAQQIVLYDIKAGTLSLISKSTAGLPGNNASYLPHISFNGRYIAYITSASNIAADANVNKKVVVRYDVKTGETKVVNIDASNVLSNGSAEETNISGDGRFIVFSDSSTNFVSDNTGGLYHIYLKDMVTGQLVAVSRGIGNSAANNSSSLPSIAANSFNANDGLISFTSLATNLTDPSLSSGEVNNVFTIPFTRPRPPLSNGTPIDLPPALTVNKKNVLIQMQSFTIPSNLRASSNATSSVQYEIVVIPKQKKNGPRKKITSKRNRVVARNLKAGTYTTTYRAVVTKNGKVKAKTTYSPKIQFSIS
jgi:hypothetical protein